MLCSCKFLLDFQDANMDIFLVRLNLIYSQQRNFRKEIKGEETEFPQLEDRSEFSLLKLIWKWTTLKCLGYEATLVKRVFF